MWGLRLMGLAGEQTSLTSLLQMAENVYT